MGEGGDRFIRAYKAQATLAQKVARCGLWWVSAKLITQITQASPGHPGPEEMCVTSKCVLRGAELPEGSGMACMALVLLLALHTNHGNAVPWQEQDSLRICWVEGREP